MPDRPWRDGVTQGKSSVDPPFPHFDEDQDFPAVGRQPIRAFEGPELVRVLASSFADAELVIRSVRSGRTVVLNAAGMRETEARRLVDFVSGGVVAMDGQIHRIGNGVFLFAPMLSLICRI